MLESALKGKPMPHMVYNSYVRLLMITSVACGLEFCLSAGFVYIPSLLMTSGVEGLEMSLILSLAPILAIFTMPYIAKLGDDYQQRQHAAYNPSYKSNRSQISRVNGGRKPIILTLSLGVIASLIVLGTYKDISLYAPLSIQATVAKGLLVAGVFGLDFCSQVCLNPFESLLADLYQNTGWSELSYAIYSSMLALGSCVGYLIVAVDQEQAISYLMGSYIGGVPHPETPIFFFLAILFVLSLFATMLTLGNSSGTGANSSITLTSNKVEGKCSSVLLMEETNLLTNDDDGYESNNSEHGNDSELLVLVFDKLKYYKIQSTDNKGDPSLLKLKQISLYENDKINLSQNEKRTKTTTASSNLIIDDMTPLNQTTIYKIVSSCLCNRMCHRPTKMLLKNFLKLRSILRYVRVWVKWPLALRRLFWAHLFMWTSLMIHNLFYADYMGRYIYGGDPKFEPGAELRNMYEKGIRAASWGLLFHSLMAAFVSPLLERFVISPDRLNIKTVYILSLILFNGAMVVLILAPVDSVILCNLVTTLTGVTLAVVNSAPFILLTKYHSHKSKYYFDQRSQETSHRIDQTSSPLDDGEEYQGNGQLILVDRDCPTLSLRRQHNQRPNPIIRPTGIGTDIAVLDIGFFLSQIIATTLVGQIIKVTPDPRYYMVSALAISSLGCYISKHMIATDSDLKSQLSSNH